MLGTLIHSAIPRFTLLFGILALVLLAGEAVWPEAGGPYAGPRGDRDTGLPRVEADARDAVELTGSAKVHVLLKGRRPIEPRPSEAQKAAYLGEVAAARRAFRGTLPARGVTILREHDWAFGLLVEVDASGLESLEQMPQVDYVYVDRPLHANLSQGVPLIGADQVQNSGYTGTGMTIAILDTGIDYNHSALGGCFGTGCKVLDGWDFVNSDANPLDDNGHGTSVAGIAAANQGSLKGVAPDASLAAVKVLNSAGSGSFGTVDSGLNWVLNNYATHNIKVANMSLGDGLEHGSSGSGTCATSTTASLIQNLVNVGVAVTASSGNEGFDFGIGFPACVAEATAVGGVYDADVGSVSWCGNSSCTTILCTDNPTFADKFVCHTSSGDPLDVLAPDYRTTTTQIFGGTRSFGGTSAAAPYAAGAFALMMAVAPAADVATIEANLVSTGVLVLNPDNGVSYPRIDVAAAAQNFDADLDGHGDSSDNCPDDYNPGQEDADGDTLGDACDNCPDLSNIGQENADGDPSGDACDCDDANDSIYVGAPEVCDGLNNDCDDPTWPSLEIEVDNDGDGQAECGGDCDDADPARRSGVPELCDGIDNDCDNFVPDSEQDSDADGWRTCEGDCNDFDPNRFPGNPEICDGIDNDCSAGVPIDEWDTDGDGFKPCEGDCDDSRDNVHPGGTEICDGHDNDCFNGLPADEQDTDTDGVMICEGDCDDADGAIYPGSPEVCDGRNNDCDHPDWPLLTVESDDDSDGAAECEGDCDDNEPRVGPSFLEVCDELDNDCDGGVDPGSPVLVEPFFLDAAADPNAVSGDGAGSAVIAVDDLNGDGIPDLVAGAPGWPSGTNLGKVIFFSGADRSFIRQSTDPLGSNPAKLGSSLASPGDVDGDGVPDVASAAPVQSVGLGIAQGRVLMFSGATGAEIWSFQDSLLPGMASLGKSLAAIGDMNGNGIGEIVAGAIIDCAGGQDCSGSARIIDGATGSSIRLLTDPSDTFGEEFGSAVASLGDLDGDGKDDVAVGAPKKQISIYSEAGAALIFSGATGSLIRQITDPAPASGDLMGSTLASIGDVDGDSKVDLAVGSPGRDTGGGAGAGQVLVFSGANGSLLHRLEDPNGAAGDEFGAALASAGDVTKDFKQEILVGAPKHDTAAGANAGVTLLFNGATGSLLGRFEHSAGAASDRFGASVTGIAPLDGDGFPELVAGVPGDDGLAGSASGTLQIHTPQVVGDCDGDAIRNDVDDCTDADGDGFGSELFFPPTGCPAECDDEHPEVWPGSPQVCDGFNNDCNDPTWPVLSPDECFEISNLGLSIQAGQAQLDWDVPPGAADEYRIYSGDRTDIDAGRNGGFCLATTTSNTALVPDDPPAGGMTFYIVAGVRNLIEGSRGLYGPGLEREHADVCQ